MVAGPWQPSAQQGCRVLFKMPHYALCKDRIYKKINAYLCNRLMYSYNKSYNWNIFRVCCVTQSDSFGFWNLVLCFFRLVSTKVIDNTLKVSLHQGDLQVFQDTVLKGSKLRVWAYPCIFYTDTLYCYCYFIYFYFIFIVILGKCNSLVDSQKSSQIS